MSAPHREALATLQWGLLHEPSAFTMLVGETGTGKTTLINAILSEHRERIRTAYVMNPKLEIEELMRLILDQFGTKDVQPGKLALLRAFEALLAGLTRAERVVVVVDDAQDLSNERLEDLRLLSNCGSSGPNRPHFVLVGQSELLSRLNAPALRNVNQRIGARTSLTRLRDDEAFQYVDYLLLQKGRSAEKIFKQQALRYLITHSGGIPRQINLLCHSAMLAAYAANAQMVTLECARTAVAEYEELHESLYASRSPGATLLSGMTTWRFATMGAIGLATAAVIYISPVVKSGHSPAHVFQTASAAYGAAVSQKNEVFPPTIIVGVQIPAAAAALTPDDADRSPARPAAPIAVMQIGAYAPNTPSTTKAPGVASAAQAVPTTSLERRPFVVRPGDTLETMAQRHLGFEIEPSQFAQVNRQLADINEIYPGETVYLPVGPGLVVMKKPHRKIQARRQKTMPAMMKIPPTNDPYADAPPSLYYDRGIGGMNGATSDTRNTETTTAIVPQSE